MIEIKYAHLADFVGEGRNGKPIVVGIFDQVYALVETPQGFAVPLSYLIVALKGSIMDTGEHRGEIQLVDADGDAITGSPMTFNGPLVKPAGPGQPYSGLLVTILGSLVLPRVGDYEFVVKVDGRRLGTVPLSLIPPPTYK
jgi:hypothetical protein